MRSSSNTLFKLAYGVQNLPVVMALVPLAVIATIAVYNLLLSRVGPRKTLLATSLGSGATLFALYFWIETGAKLPTAILYLFREAYVVLLIEQYWAFLNSTLKENEAKRVNGPIAGWASLGAIGAGFAVGALAAPIGTPGLLLFAAALMLPGALLSDWGYRLCGEPQHPPKKTHTVGGLKLFRSSRLLVVLFALIVITQVYSTFVGLNFQSALQEAIPTRDAQTAFSGKFFGVVNVVAALGQFVLAPWLMGLLPVYVIHWTIPLIHIVCLGSYLLFPGLHTAGLTYLAFKSLDYSIFRASKEVLYIPLSFDARFRAKKIIDLFGYRFGKGGTSLVIVVLQRAGFAMESLYAWAALGAAIAWTALVGQLRSEGEKAKAPKSRG